jgi:hypothetical protein
VLGWSWVPCSGRKPCISVLAMVTPEGVVSLSLRFFALLFYIGQMMASKLFDNAHLVYLPGVQFKLDFILISYYSLCYIIRQKLASQYQAFRSFHRGTISVTLICRLLKFRAHYWQAVRKLLDSYISLIHK